MDFVRFLQNYIMAFSGECLTIDEKGKKPVDATAPMKCQMPMLNKSGPGQVGKSRWTKQPDGKLTQMLRLWQIRVKLVLDTL